MEKPTRTIKTGFKVAEGLSKLKTPAAWILAFVGSLFLNNAVNNSPSDKK
jgi:hypothetical protein